MIASMQSAMSFNSQSKAFRTAERPPIIPITNSEINKIHSNVNTPRRLRFLLLVRCVRFISPLPCYRGGQEMWQCDTDVAVMGSRFWAKA